jgi:hypothetical protein
LSFLAISFLAHEVTERAGTISNELFTRLGARFERVYVKEQKARAVAIYLFPRKQSATFPRLCQRIRFNFEFPSFIILIVFIVSKSNLIIYAPYDIAQGSCKMCKHCCLGYYHNSAHQLSRYSHPLVHMFHIFAAVSQDRHVLSDDSR